jgi:hypothetical protein
MHRKALGIAKVLRQPVKMLYMHAAAPRAIDTPAIELQVDPPSGNREISEPQDPFVVTHGTGDHSANRWLFFSPPELNDTSVSVTKYTLQLGGRHEPEQREQCANRLGFLMLLAYPKNGSLYYCPMMN